MQTYLTSFSLCYIDLNRVQADATLGDTPLWFGEWGLPTQFNATDDFLHKWADAQKLAYSKGAGWIVSTLTSRHCQCLSLIDGCSVTLTVLELQGGEINTGR